MQHQPRIYWKRNNVPIEKCVAAKLTRWLFCAFFLIFLTKEAAAEQFFYLYHVPSAKPKTLGAVEGCMMGGVGLSGSGLRVTGYGFLNAQLTNRVALNGLVQQGGGGVGLQLSLFQYRDPKSDMVHYFGAGVANSGGVGFKELHASSTNGSVSSLAPAFPLLNYYVNYTAELPPGGSWIHFGVGSNQLSAPAIVAFTGLEVDFDMGTGFVEWDGSFVNFGFKYKLNEGIVLHTYVSPSGASNDSSITNLAMFGASIQEVLLKAPSNALKAADTKKPETELKEVSSLTLESAIQKLNQSNKYFYQGQYELARDELEKVKTVFPTPDTFSRLGSVYFKLNDRKRAIENWERALKLNPQNETLKKFLNQIKKDEKPDATPAAGITAPAKEAADTPKAAEPVKAPEPAKTAEPVKATEPAKTTEPVKAAEPAKTPESAKAPEPAKPAEPVKETTAPTPAPAAPASPSANAGAKN